MIVGWQWLNSILYLEAIAPPAKLANKQHTTSPSEAGQLSKLKTSNPPAAAVSIKQLK